MSTQPPHTQAHTQPIPPRYSDHHSASPSPTDAVPPETSTDSNSPNPPTDADTYYWQHWPEIQAQFLQQQLADAVERTEKFAKHLDQQVKFFRAGFSILAVVFTAFFTFLQVRQVFLDERENRRAIRQDSWELIHAVVSNGNQTSAGLTFAIESLTQQCQSLSGLELKNRYLPQIEFVPPSANSVNSGLERIGHLFGVRPDRYCAEQEQMDLRGINLEGSTLISAQFREADLQGANFQAAKLDGTVFEAVDLRESNFQDAQLHQVRFEAVNLKGSNLKSANLQNAEFCKFPDGSDPQMMTIKQYKQHCADLSQTQNLTFDQVQQAQDWQYALYNSATCEQFRSEGMTAETAPVSCQLAESQSAERSSSESNVL